MFNFQLRRQDGHNKVTTRSPQQPSSGRSASCHVITIVMIMNTIILKTGKLNKMLHLEPKKCCNLRTGVNGPGGNHADSRAFSAYSPRILRARGKCAENARRICGEYCSFFIQIWKFQFWLVKNCSNIEGKIFSSDICQKWGIYRQKTWRGCRLNFKFCTQLDFFVL